MRSKSAADFKKRVDACRTSATCNLEETCTGNNGFSAQQAKAQDIVEVRLNSTLTLMPQTLRRSVARKRTPQPLGGKATCGGGMQIFRKAPRTAFLDGHILTAVTVTRSEPGPGCSCQPRDTDT